MLILLRLEPEMKINTRVESNNFY